MKKLVLIFAAAAIVFSACNSNNNKSSSVQESNKETKQELLQMIKNTEKEVFDVPPEKINQSKAKFLAGYYVQYAAFGDSLAPEFLYKAAGIYMNTGAPAKSIDALNEIINKHPDFNKIENCYFLRGFVYDDKLKDTVNAGKYYREYLQKYPKGDFAPDARLLLENMGKSTEEIFEEIKKK